MIKNIYKRNNKALTEKSVGLFLVGMGKAYLNGYKLII